MSRIWFTSDHHFGHRNIVSLSNRPFSSIEEHDAELMSRWNAVVRPDDEIYHLGDFAYRNAKSAESYLTRLNGRKHLIHGNHDSDLTQAARGWSSSTPMMNVKIEGHLITLCHYAMRVWPKSHHGALHFYGHSHGNLAGDRQSLDVGVDSWGFYPVSLHQILERLQTQPERELSR